VSTLFRPARRWTPGGGGGGAEAGPITAGRNYFTDANGKAWTYKGVSMFLLYYRWLLGEDIGPVVSWCAAMGANVVRVLGMVNWPNKGQTFGPGINANWWPELPRFIEYLASRGMRIEFVVFASAQDIMPKQDEQRTHLHRVVDTIGGVWNVFIEIANEPGQNGCDPVAIWNMSEPRPCPMAYGMNDMVVTQQPDGLWVATMPHVLSYITPHLPRDPEDAWSRKAKDLSEYRDGSGDGSENGPLFAGAHVPPVSDEPKGASEAAAVAGRQRSAIAEHHLWHHGNALINGAGSTFHHDAGLQAVLPKPDGDEQKCADAVAVAWANIPAEFQTGTYTRGGLDSLPMVWQGEYFPEASSRIYGRILGDRAVCIAIKPLDGWVPAAAPGWRITAKFGPMDSLVHLERA
jgi:hypothetical protein